MSEAAPGPEAAPGSEGSARPDEAAGAKAQGDVGPALVLTSGLFGFQRRGAAVAAVADAGWLQAMLDFEAGLAGAEARAGVMAPDVAEAIAAQCDAKLYDADALGRAAAAHAVPSIALVHALTARVRETAGPDAAGHVHEGATSQDVMDTAMALLAQRALAPLIDDLAGAADAAAALADARRATAMAGRTWLQQGLPTTFGLVAAGWLSGLDRSRRRLEEVRAGLAVQLGGAVGTLASLGEAGPSVLAYLADELGLAEPELAWHTERTRVAELAAALGEAAGACAKVATDVVLLAQTELGEVSEGVAGRGGSSTMPQKENPVAAVSVRAAAARTPGLVATLLAAMPGELQRAAGGWQAEWTAISDLLVATGSAVAWLRDCLEHLEVHPDRMEANLAATGGLIHAERVVAALAPSMGRGDAHAAVERAAHRAAASGEPFADCLGREPEIAGVLDRPEIERLLQPSGYLGSAGLFVDRALGAHHRGPVGRAARFTPPASEASPSPAEDLDLARAIDGPSDAPVLVLSHSLGTDRAIWDPLLPALARRFRVVRYDLRGHGASPVPMGPYEIADLGRDLLKLLDELDVERAHLAGLSIGGMLTLWVAAHAPERVDRLAVVCTSARLGGSGSWAERAALVRARGTGAIAESVVGRWLTPPFAAANQPLVARLRRLVSATPAEGYAGCCEAIETMDLAPDLARITAPTLVVMAADDEAIPPSHGEPIAAGIANARLELLSDAAHLPTAEQPAALADLLLTHLDMIETTAAGGRSDATAHHERRTRMNGGRE